jgi:hypothetical protein
VKRSSPSTIKGFIMETTSKVGGVNVSKTQELEKLNLQII